MYAIVRIVGKQFQAEEGKTLVMDKLPYDVGTKVEFEEVLLIGDGANTVVGQPLVSGALIKAEVVEQFKGKKIIVFKYKPKKRYRLKKGHRQLQTRLMINEIVAPSGEKKKAKPRSKKSETAAAEAEE